MNLGSTADPMAKQSYKNIIKNLADEMEHRCHQPIESRKRKTDEISNEDGMSVENNSQYLHKRKHI